MDFEIPQEIRQKLDELDAFIEREIKPLERENMQFFDFRREHARTDWDNGGTPRPEWEALLREMRRRADAAGHLRYALPKELGGQDGTNLAMAIIREHLANKGLGLHNDLQNEASIVGNFPSVVMMQRFGNKEQQAEFLDGIINGKKRFNSGLHHANYDMIFARTGGEPGEADGITCFIVPTDLPGFSVDFMWWTFNMPSDHAEVTLREVRVPNSAIFGEEGRGLELAQTFVHENRIRQAASGVGAAQYCIDESIAYAKERLVFGKPLWLNQAIQFPLAELQTECEMVRNLVYKTAWHLDRNHHMDVTDKVSMCNYRANRLVCDAADRAIQVHGGIGYTRHKPFEHIYRHHRRYRITEGSEEIQIRRVAGIMFGKRAKR